MNKNYLRSLKCLFVSVMLFGLTACAMGGIMDGDTYPPHHFSFNTQIDNPHEDVEVLDYQYSNSRHAGIRPEREGVEMGETYEDVNIYGPILRGDFLYVKWRISKPGTSDYLGPYEDRVDLKSRLPANIDELRIHFVIHGPQLYVYLIWPYDLKHEYPVGPLKEFGKVKQVQIYPDQPR